MCKERCGIEVKESALSVCRAPEENHWDRKPWGGMPHHFRHLAHHIDGKVVLLRTNTPKIMDSRFGPDTAVTLAAFWSPGMAEAKVYHTIRNETTTSHQHCFDSTPWQALFSTGRHVGGEIWVEEGDVGSGPHGRRGRRQCRDGINRPGHRYRVDRQPVVLRTGAWHATCPWKGDRRLVVLYGRGEWHSLPPSHSLHNLCLVGHCPLQQVIR